jgi:type II secretory pathway component PulK
MSRLRRGGVLMVALWVMAILAVFALALGQRSALDLKIARVHRDSLRAGWLAASGIAQAVALIDADESPTYDTIAECGFSLKGKQPQEILNRDWEDYGGFRIEITDEERKINAVKNKDQLKRVMTERARYSDAFAGKVIAAINPQTPLNVPEELPFVIEGAYLADGQAPEEALAKSRADFSMFKDLITIYGEGRVNLNTAPKEVLDVLCAETPNAGGLGQKIIDFRERDFFNENTVDAVKNEFAASSSLTADESAAIDALYNQTLLSVKSDNFRIKSTGTVNSITKVITAVYSRSTKKFVYWQEA